MGLLSYSLVLHRHELYRSNVHNSMQSEANEENIDCLFLSTSRIYRRSINFHNTYKPIEIYYKYITIDMKFVSGSLIVSITSAIFG
jgi:hypothetical protein